MKVYKFPWKYRDVNAVEVIFQATMKNFGAKDQGACFILSFVLFDLCLKLCNRSFYTSFS